MGEVLIGAMSTLLISIFLGPQFIRFLHHREFGQHIRDEGPIETPREGRHANHGRRDHLLAVVIPVLVLADITRAARSP